MQIWDSVPAGSKLILPCPTGDTDALQPVFSENMLDGGTRSLQEPQLLPGSHPSLSLGFHSSTGLASSWWWPQKVATFVRWWVFLLPTQGGGIPTPFYPWASAAVLGWPQPGLVPNPLPASFPEELEPGLSTCSDSTSISINFPGKKNYNPEVPAAKTLPTL